MFEEETKVQVTKEIVLERYKFIIEKQKYLDSLLHKNMDFYLKVITAIMGIFFSSASIYKNKPEIISLDSLTLMLELTSILTIFVSSVILLMTASIACSWFDYRKDEVKILDQVDGSYKREMPKKRNFWLWHESIFAFALSIIIGFFVFVICNVEYFIGLVK
ncbi:hypothetical protein [Veronia pacifica]|uniref:Uncharacterized protein n=1 Tax=Veronia pacifica TaxID=1080227 RepID=A0A1C3E9F8_9GAMM|nr:hypothetical protein [Veronia pacifica]ODA29872.1 hypothetical protein A8L45_21470 [Veronia pacifica]